MKRVRTVEPGGNYFSSPKRNLSFIKSGSKLLDLALGGGWAENRVINIVGNKSSGKTLLAIEASTNFAKKYPKGKVRYRECESAFDENYAKALGMPIDRIDFDVHLETVEDMHKDLSKVIQKATTEELYIVDSLDALSDIEEMERDFDKGSYGMGKAKNMSKLFRMLTSQMADKKVTLIIISQVRDKIGVIYGKKTTRGGGRALDFYSSQVAMLTEVEKTSKTFSNIKRVTGLTIKANIEKNKVALPFRQAEFNIQFGYGIDDVEACLDWLKEANRLADYSKGTPKEILGRLSDADDKDYWNDVKRLHQIVETNWYSIEKHFLPTRRKQ
jgi:recombination protein RecA